MKYSLTIIFTLALFTNSFQAQEALIKDNKIVGTNQEILTYEELDLSDLGLTKLPVNLPEFINLKQLNLSSNLLEDVALLGKLIKLEKLTLDDNPNLKVSSLNGVASQLLELKELSIQSSNMTFIPFDIFNLNNLEVLNLSDNKIELVSFEIKKMKSLQVLDLSANDIWFIDNGMVGLRNLNQLNLAENQIKNIPHLFCQLTSLKHLTGLNVDFDEYKWSKIKVIPISSVKQLTLSSFDEFYKNSFFQYFLELEKLTVIGEADELAFNSLLSEVRAKELVSVSFYSNSLEGFPQGLTNFRLVEELYFKGNKFQAVPNFMNRFKNLESIEIRVVDLDLEKSIANLIPVSKLTTLTIATQKGVALPINTSKLKALVELNIQAKSLSAFPNRFTSMIALKEVNLFLEKTEVKNLSITDREMSNCKFILNSVTIEKLSNGMNPPLQVANIEFEDFNVNSTAEKTLTTISGTTIDIPKNAFLDKNGNPVKGNVRIEYREFNDPIDMAFAGVPMMEEVNGEVFTYASAGMMEFRAFQQNEELSPNPENLITVNYNSPFAGDEYDLFYLDPEKAAWSNIGKDSIQPQSVNRVSSNTVLDSMSEFPSAPVYASIPFRKYGISVSSYLPKRNRKMLRHIARGRTTAKVRSSQPGRIKRDTNNMAYSELKRLNKVKWVLDFSDHDGMNAEQYKTFIEDMSEFNENAQSLSSFITNSTFRWGQLNYVSDFWLEPNIKKDNFSFVFSIFGDEVRVPVLPINLPKRPEVAQRKIKSFYKRYKKALAARRDDWDFIENKFDFSMGEYNERMRTYEEDQKKYREEVERYNKATLRNLKTFAATEGGVIRSFQLAGFGSFNCDIRNRMGNPEPLLASFQDEKGENLKISRLYILDKVNNGLLSFLNTEDAFFDKKSTNCLIAILPNEKIGILSSVNFKAEELTVKGFTKTLSIYDMKTTSIDQLRKDADFF